MGTESRLGLPTIDVLEELTEEILDTVDTGEFIIEVDSETVSDLALSLGVLLQRGLPYDEDLVETIATKDPRYNHIKGYRHYLRNVENAVDIDIPELEPILESKTLCPVVI